jgi:4,5-DOPA dioxygenase extradiol
VAAEIITLLRARGIDAVANDSVGYDHGAWVPLMYLAPEARIPVLQIAQPPSRDPKVLFALGAALAPLREQGILVVGSGSLTHNLYEFRMGTTANGYAQKFADWVADALVAGDLETLFNYRSLAPEAERAHPTDEHFLPLYFALGAAGADAGKVRRLAAGVSDDVISMDSFVFGEA